MSVNSLLESYELEPLWRQVLTELRAKVSEQQFYTWFEGMVFEVVSESEIKILVRDEFAQDWISQHYHSLLLSLLQKFSPQIDTLDLVVGTLHLAKDLPVSESFPQSIVPDTIVAPSRELPKLNSKFTFSSFVEGECNKSVLAAAKIVAQNPGTTEFNPLVIYGDTGLGKSHLAQAIGHYAFKQETASKIIYRTSEELMSECIEQMRLRKTVDFHKIYRNIDILILDDIQFLARSRETVEEFTKLFAMLRQDNKQVVITCDQYPSEVQDHKGRKLHSRLLSRLDSGLITDLLPPSQVTRRNILQSKIKHDPSLRVLTSEVLDYISSRKCLNVRELEGMMLKVFAFHNLMKSSISLDVARRVLGDTARNSVAKVTLTKILEAVAESFSVDSELLVSQSRKKSIALARKVAMYLCRALTDNSLHTIGMKFNRDYTTVIFSIKTLMKAMEKDTKLEHQVSTLKDQILSP